MLNEPTQDVFELVLARPVATGAGEHGSLAHLWWSAPQQASRLVQVYVDRELTDVSTHPDQREMWLVLDRSAPRRIELLAVPPGDVWAEQPEALGGWDPAITGEVTLGVLRDEALPVDTRLTVSVDGVDTDHGQVWPPSEHRGGFGGLFGVGGFGHDAATGPGLGRGELGWGPLGTDGRAWRWRGGDLQTGIHNIDLIPTDRSGQSVAPIAGVPGVVVDRLPEPASTFTIDPDFTLRWTHQASN